MASWYKDWIADWDGELADDSVDKSTGEHKFGDIVNIVKIYCKDWQDSPLDIATFFFCLAFYHKPITPKENVIYEQEIIEIGYHYGRFAFAAYKAGKDLVLKNLMFLDEEDYIAGEWDKEVLGKAPAYYCAIDHDEKNVILALRGTKTRSEVLTDLAARFVEWREGFAHLGFVKSVEDLEKLVKDLIIEQMNKWEPKGYRLRIVGHSMGAAVAALLVLQWTEEFPSWDIHGYGYATPCCISGNLEEKSSGIFTTYVHHFDAVTRLSMGAIEDLHNGMRMFVEKLGDNSRLLAVTRAIKESSISDEHEEIFKAAQEIDELIQRNIQNEADSGSCKKVAHLFPAGTTYQLWREKRGNNFVTWQMYRSKYVDYGRLNFSPTMLKDHGTGGYKEAFENMLAITVVERQLWYGMRKEKRLKVKEYWETHSDNDPFCPSYDMDIVVKTLKEDSKYKRKALKRGLIRPFLFLISMSPKRRAALAYLMGMNFIHKKWYHQFSPHLESYYLLTKKGRGLKDRGNLTAHSLKEGFSYMKSAVKQTFSGHPGAINMLTKKNNWFMILYSCSVKVKSMQKEYLPDEVEEMLDEMKIHQRKTIKYCSEPRNKQVNEMEQVLLYLFFTLISKEVTDESEEEEDEDENEQSESSHDGDTTPETNQVALEKKSKKEIIQNTRNDSPDDESSTDSSPDEQKSSDDSGPEQNTTDQGHDVNRNTKESKVDKSKDSGIERDPEKVKKKLKDHDFTNQKLIELIMEQCENDSANKKANEVYSWGNILRRESDKWRKRDVAVVGGLGVVVGSLLAVGIPTAVVPPVGIIPLSAAFAILGITITKAKAGGLIPIVAGCLQQRIALAFHDICIDDYYGVTEEVKREIEEGQEESDSDDSSTFDDDSDTVETSESED